MSSKLYNKLDKISIKCRLYDFCHAWIVTKYRRKFLDFIKKACIILFMNTTLFHSTICLPPNLNKFFREYELKISGHAVDSTIDKNGFFAYPSFVRVHHKNVVEVETNENGEIIKILVRIPYKYKAGFDLCIVIIPDGKQARVKTGWLNSRKDNHKTLDVTKYLH